MQSSPSADSLKSRRAGLLYGSFIAEALALGVHWNYDPADIARKHGQVTDFMAPGAGSYHPHKLAGEQGHVGDQALRLMAFLHREQHWHAPMFLTDWAAMWPDYTDYVDKATKATLANLAAGATLANCGSTSDELAGPARIAPLVAFKAEADEEVLSTAAIEQTLVTHHSQSAIACAEFLARLMHRLLLGEPLEPTLRALAPAWALAAAEQVLAPGTVDAIGQLGRSCPIPAALPAVIYLVLKHGSHLEAAFIENAMAGGDNCARGLVLGMILGAAYGVEAIPQRWISGLRAAPAIEAFLALR
jgi:ADP-ribosylglycohydrolase